MEPGPLLAKGRTAEVYAWGEGKVLKLFVEGRGADQVEYEFALAQKIAAAGLDIPAAFETREIRGRHGIIYERITGRSNIRSEQAALNEVLVRVHSGNALLGIEDSVTLIVVQPASELRQAATEQVIHGIEEA